MSTECETRAKFEADARLAGYSNFNRERGRYCHVELEVFYQGYLMGGRQVSAAQSAPAGVSEGWKLVPVEPTEEMWSGLARHLMMWLDFGNPTVEALRKHLDMLNIEWPAWMDAESELRGSGVPSEGTRATLIYKAMLYAAPAQPAARLEHGDRLREFTDELKQLCKDFSDLQDRPYMGDVTSAIDGLYEQFASTTTSSTPPASPDVEGLVKALEADFPLLDDNGLDETLHHCEWSIQQERKRLHATLSTWRQAQENKP